MQCLRFSSVVTALNRRCHKGSHQLAFKNICVALICVLGCVPLAVEVQMREMPHAAERTIIRIRVVEHLLTQGRRPTFTKIDESLNQSQSNASLTSQLNEDSGQRYGKGAGNVDMTDLDVETPRDCERYVNGDVRGQSKESKNV